MVNIAEQEKKKELIRQFSANIEMREAVKEILLAGMYTNGVIKEGEKHNPLVNWALSVALNGDEAVSNEQIGARVVAIGEGLRFIESAFKKIEEDYKEIKPTPPKGNGAR